MTQARAILDAEAPPVHEAEDPKQFFRTQLNSPEMVMRGAGLEIQPLHKVPGSLAKKAVVFVRGKRRAGKNDWTVDYVEFVPTPTWPPREDKANFSRIVVYLNGSEIFDAGAPIDFSQRRLKEACYWIRFCADNGTDEETARQIVTSNICQVESITEGVIHEAESPKRALHVAQTEWQLVRHEPKASGEEWEFVRLDGWGFRLTKRPTQAAWDWRLYVKNPKADWAALGTQVKPLAYEDAYASAVKRVQLYWRATTAKERRLAQEAEDPKKAFKHVTDPELPETLLRSYGFQQVANDQWSSWVKVSATDSTHWSAIRFHGTWTIRKINSQTDKEESRIEVTGSGEMAQALSKIFGSRQEAEDPKAAFKQLERGWQEAAKRSGYVEKDNRHVYHRDYDAFRVDSDVIELPVSAEQSLPALIIFDVSLVSKTNEMEFGTFTLTPTIGELVDIVGKLHELFAKWTPPPSPPVAASEIKNALIAVFGKERAEESSDGVYVSQRWNEAEDPKRALKAAQNAVGNRVRTMLEKCKFKEEARDIRYERWVRPGFEPDARWEAVRYMPGGDERWDLTKYMREGTTPLWSMNALSSDNMLFRLKRLFCLPHTGEPFECFNPYGQ